MLGRNGPVHIPKSVERCTNPLFCPNRYHDVHTLVSALQLPEQLRLAAALRVHERPLGRHGLGERQVVFEKKGLADGEVESPVLVGAHQLHVGVLHEWPQFNKGFFVARGSPLSGNDGQMSSP